MDKGASELSYKMMKKLYEEGKNQSQIAVLLECSQAWVSKILNRYKTMDEGDVLKKGKPRGRTPKLSIEQVELLKFMLVEGALKYGFPTDNWTQIRIAELIKDRFSIKYHPAHISNIMQRINFTSQKPSHRSYKQSESDVEDWKENILPNLKKSPK